jgi:hypothetical protein
MQFAMAICDLSYRLAVAERFGLHRSVGARYLSDVEILKE